MAAVAGTFIDGQISVQFLSNPQQKKKNKHSFEIFTFTVKNLQFGKSND